MFSIRPSASLTGPALVFVVAFGSACEVNLNSEGIVSRETKKFTVQKNPNVHVETFDGTIEVHSWDRDEVEVEIEKRAMEQSLVDEMQVSAEQQGNRVVIKVSRPRRQESGGIQVGVHFSPTARLRVVLPKQTQLTAFSGDGSIVVEDVAGNITLTTNDGSVRASRIVGEIKVRSGDGTIRMENIEGKLDLETEDGGINVEAKPTAFRARTADGSIRVQIESDSAMSEDWDFQTADGTVVLTLPASFNAELDAESRDGSVRATHSGVKTETRSGDGEGERRRSVKATLGSGGKTLRVRTGDGSIRIES
jgi:DUF4097 and DUF4098 domain-containing protein YvlB